jgi:hypothetical protein
MDDAGSGLEGCHQSVYDYVSKSISLIAFLTFTQIFLQSQKTALTFIYAVFINFV